MVNYKTNSKIIKKFKKRNHSNILTLDYVFSTIRCCDIIATSTDNCIGRIRIISIQK